MRMLLALLALAAAAPQSPDGGLKIVTVQEHAEGLPMHTTEYVTRDKGRTEFREVQGSRPSPSGPTTFAYGPRSGLITRCDLGQQFYVNFDRRDYMTVPQPGVPRMVGPVPVMPPQAGAPPANGPTMSIEVTTTDTGERKRVFGYLARHVIVVRKQTASEPAAGPSNEMKIDGWYIDLLDARPHCESSGGQLVSAAALIVGGGATAHPRVIIKESGAPERGFPIDVTYTHSEWPARSMSRKVTELTSRPLDPSLFEVPSGFYHANRWDRVMMMRAASMWHQIQMQAWQQLEHARQLVGWNR